MLALRATFLLVAVVLVAAPAAHARPDALLPPQGKVLTGVAMGYELGDFTSRTGRKPAVWEQFLRFGQSPSWAIRLAAQEDTRLMLALSTAASQDQPGSISPGEIAAGRGDRWLLALRRELEAFGRPVYLRLLGEMNNCHNAYAPLSCTGASRGSAYSTRSFIRAWRHVAALMRAGTARVVMVWTPMTGGSPNVAALDPARFWPGRRWVDWVGTSLYSKFPRFGPLSAYYRRFSARYRLPFMLAEWAMWDNGDPGFVRAVLAFSRSHPRTRMLVYNQGKRVDGPFRLRRYPAAAAALRRGLRAASFV